MLHNQNISHAQIAANPNLLESLLLGILDPSKVQQATQALTDFLATPGACPPLVHVICKSESPLARNLGAVYLRSKFGNYVEHLSKKDEDQLKTVLINQLVNEPDVKVLRSLGQLTIRVAKQFGFGDGHSALLQVIEQILQQNQTEKTEVAITLLRNLVPLTEGEPFQNLAGIFQGGLQGSEKVQIESLKGLQALAVASQSILDNKVLEEREQILVEIYKIMAQVCQRYIRHEDEAISRYVIEMWSDLFADGCLSGAETDIYQFMLKVCGEKDLNINVRYQVVDYMKFFCKQFPNRLIKENLLEPTMVICINLLMENYQETDDDVSNPLSIAIEVLDGVFLNVRVDKTISLALQGVKQLVQQGHLRAALALCAIMTEGCAEVMREKSLLNELYQLLEQGMTNEDAGTRKVAYEALTQFVYHLSPTMNEYANQLMPKIFQAFLVEQNNQENLEVACIMLDSYCSALEESIKPFINKIFETLFQLLQDGSTDVKVAAVSAISSSCRTAREVKQPVNLKELTLVLLKILNADSEDESVLNLKAEAINCLGEVCLTLQRDKTLAIDQETNFIQKIISGASTKHGEIRESTFMFFGILAQLFQADLLKTGNFENMLKLCLDCLENEDGLVTQKEDDGFGNAGAPGIDEDLEAAQTKFYVMTGFLEEKTAAANAVEEFAKNCGPGFQIYWSKSFQETLDAMQYPHPQLKRQSIRTMHFLAINMMKTLKANQCASAEIKQEAEDNIRTIVTVCFVNLMREDDKECAVETLISLCELLKMDVQGILGLNNREIKDVLGETGDNADPANSWEEFMDILTFLLNEECIFQAPDDVELNEAKREIEDNPILDGLTDITSALCEGLTESQLVSYWEVVFPLLTRYLQPNRSHIEYSLAIGTMGDVSAHLSPASIQPFLKTSVEMAFKGLETSQHHLVRQNSVFALGCLCRAGRESMQPYLENIFQVLDIICKNPRGQADNRDRLLRDNALSSLGSLCAYCANNIPDENFQNIVKVFLDGLPMEDDLQENEHVARNIIRILESRGALMQPFMQQCKNLLESSLQWEGMPQELTHQIRSILSNANQQSTDI
jgi:hypothetical protein